MQQDLTKFEKNKQYKLILYAIVIFLVVFIFLPIFLGFVSAFLSN